MKHEAFFKLDDESMQVDFLLLVGQMSLTTHEQVQIDQLRESHILDVSAVD